MVEMTDIYAQVAARAQGSGHRLANAYQCQPGAYAIVELVGVQHGMTPKEMIDDVETAFTRVYLPNILKQLEVESDTVPDIDLFHGVSLFAEALGAPVSYTENEWPWAMPVLHSIADVDHFMLPNLRTSPAIQRYFDQVRWLQDHTDHRIPIKLMDLQSPFTIAAQLRHYEELLIDMLDDPDRVMRLLEMITDFSIQFLELQREVFTTPSSPGRNFPGQCSDLGICIADDSGLIPLSPSMYNDFCLPTMQRLAAEVPGIFLHSCGDYTRHVDSLLTIPNLRALQMHTGPHEIDCLASWRKMRGNVALWSDTNDVSLGDEYANRFWDCYHDYVLPRLLEEEVTGLVLLAPPADSVDGRRENIRRLREIIEVRAGS